MGKGSKKKKKEKGIFLSGREGISRAPGRRKEDFEKVQGKGSKTFSSPYYLEKKEKREGEFSTILSARGGNQRRENRGKR